VIFFSKTGCMAPSNDGNIEVTSSRSA
jgi:hypothetical protein